MEDVAGTLGSQVPSRAKIRLRHFGKPWALTKLRERSPQIWSAIDYIRKCTEVPTRWTCLGLVIPQRSPVQRTFQTSHPAAIETKYPKVTTQIQKTYLLPTWGHVSNTPTSTTRFWPFYLKRLSIYQNGLFTLLNHISLPILLAEI